MFLRHLFWTFSLGVFCITPLYVSQARADTTIRYLQFGKFQNYVNTSLRGEGLLDFEAITAEVENNIFWKKKAHENKYKAAFKRSSPHLKDLLRDDIPDFVFLIPYLESGWHATKGKPHSDYGYWQMIEEVVAEIRLLDEASDKLRAAHPDAIRSDMELSTEAALIHLKRYYFYFRHVAKFPEADAWMLSVTAFNWGAGNVKALLAEIKTNAKTGNEIDTVLTFSDFYHHLLLSSQKHPEDKSKRVALEYLPNLWNLALLVQTAQDQLGDSENRALTLNKSSSVSIP